MEVFADKNVNFALKTQIMILKNRVSSGNAFVIMWAVLSALYACIFTTIEFMDNPVGSLVGFVTLFSQWLTIAICASGLIGLLVLNKYVMAVLFTPLVWISTVLSYYRVTTGITLTPAIIELTLQNNAETAMTVISWQLVALMVLSIFAGVLVTIYRFRYVHVNRPVLYAIFAVALMSLQFLPRLHAAISARLPYSLYYCTSDYLDMRQVAREHRDTYDNIAFSCTSDSLNVIVVIGEALRPDHMQINGYERETTPLLMKQKNLISFPNVKSLYSHTFISVPHIMTEPENEKPDAAYEKQSFITPLKKAGFYTAWITNQDEMNSYSYFMHEADTLLRNEPGKNSYVFTTNLDEAMLPLLDGLTTANKRGNKCYILHCIGSHWLYTSHFSDDVAKFRPNISSRVVSANSREAIINSYDNTVRYTDFFLNSLIERFKDTKAVILFQSDHGEALGENGQFLHGFDNPGVEKAACLIWYSDAYYSENSELIDSLSAVSDKPTETSQFFHMVLSCANVHRH
jgi:glucan phosphoethanolaminetransferase (alkaline phosphatase superfamily)